MKKGEEVASGSSASGANVGDIVQVAGTTYIVVDEATEDDGLGDKARILAVAQRPANQFFEESIEWLQDCVEIVVRRRASYMEVAPQADERKRVSDAGEQP